MIKQKRAISPLISAALLILITAVLAVIIANFSRQYIEDKRDSSFMPERMIKCGIEVSMVPIIIEGMPQLYYNEDEIIFMVRNDGRKFIDNFFFQIIGLNGTQNLIVQEVNLSVGESIRINQEYDHSSVGDISSISIHPQVNYERGLFTCNNVYYRRNFYKQEFLEKEDPPDCSCEGAGHNCGEHIICEELVDCGSCPEGKICSEGVCVLECPQGATLIATCEELQNSISSLTGNYCLMQDIDCNVEPYNSGEGFIPLAGGSGNSRFAGKFYGQGYKIENLYINRPSTNFIGLFSGTRASAGIYDLKIENVEIVGQDQVGILVGSATSTTIERVSITGNVSGTTQVGGISGYTVTTTFNEVSSAGDVSGNSYVGGLVGRSASNTKIYDSYSTGNIGAIGDYVGGISGATGPSNSATSGIEILNSYASGTITAGHNSQFVGGIIGLLRGGIIENSNYLNNIDTGRNYVGGISGYLHTVTVSNVNLNSNVNAFGDNVGGLSGYTVTTTFNEVSSAGDVSGNSYVGGLVGRSASNTKIYDSYSTGNIGAIGNYVGGISGATGATTSSTSGLEILNSYASGTITAHNSIYVGGIIGFMRSSGGVIENSYSISAVFGNSHVGGAIGWLHTGLGNKLYSAGLVSAGTTNYIGGLVGRLGSATISNSFWDTTTSEQTSSEGGTGKTTAEMEDPSTFSEWDTNVWVLESGQYPRLAWEFD